MDIAQLRAWYAHRQGLDGSLTGANPAQVLARSGWARSVGGVGPYLTLFSRAGTSREGADSAVAKLEIHELPAARGCTYVVPAGDFALALRAGESFAGAERKVAYKLGVTDKEIEKLCGAVVKALGKSTLDPEGIRESVGGAARNLGEEGKKRGMITTLPLALGILQAMGEIRRVPVSGRLDQQRYRYTSWRPNPLASFKLSAEEVAVELARRYFAWSGPAAAAEFQAFAGLGVKAAKAAMDPLKLAAVEDRWMLPADMAKFEAFKPPKEPCYALVSSLDAIALLRRDLKGLLDPADLTRESLTERGSIKLGSLEDLPSHAILDRGRLIGLWLFDTETNAIAWIAFVKKNKDLEQAVRRTEEFVRDQLGDARSFALDSPKSRAPRIAALRAAC